MKYKVVYIPDFKLICDVDTFEEGEAYIEREFLAETDRQFIEVFGCPVLETENGEKYDIIEEDEYNELIVGFEE